MRRPILKTAAILVILLLLALAAYPVLTAVLPDRWILNAVSDELGLDVTARSLSVGWTGRTRLRDVKVTLPIGNEELLSAAKIELSHRAPLWLLLTGSTDLRSVTIDSPGLQVHRAPNGRWNVQDAWDRVSAGREPAATSSGPIGLPKIKVHNATIVITDTNDLTETIGPLNFEGQSRSRSLWSFTLQTAPGIEAKGQTAQGLDWAHRVDFRVEKIAPLLSALAGSNLAALEVAGHWEGRVTSQALTGQLRLDRLGVGTSALQGRIDVTVNPDGVTLRPNALLVTEPNWAGAPIEVTAGSVHLTPGEIKAEQVGLQAGNISASLDGHWADQTHLGAATLSWTAGLPDKDAKGQGTCELTWRSPPFGQKEAEIKLTTGVQTNAGSGNITAKVLGTGRTWKDSDWEVSVPKSSWSRGDRSLDVTGAQVRIALSWPKVRLTALHWPNAEKLNAQAEFDASTGKWSAQIDGRGVSLGALAVQPFDLRFSGAGDNGKLTLSELAVTQGQRKAVAKGELSLSDRSFRTVHVSAQWPVAARTPEAATAPRELGRWQCETDITGRLDPMTLEIQGALSGTNVPFGERTVKQVDIPVRADINTERLAITTEPFTLLDGRWRISGRHEWSNTLTQLSLAMEGLSLKSAASAVGSPLACQGQVKAELQLAAPGLRLQEAVAVGGWSAEAIEIPPFRVETAQGKVRIANGLVRFDEIHLKHGQGQANGNLQFRLDCPELLSLAFKMTTWPVRLKDRSLEFWLDGTTDAQLDVLAKTAQGQGQLEGSIVWKEKELGHMTLTSSVQGRTLAIQKFEAQSLGGTIEGSAEIPLDRWTQGTGHLQWHDIEPNGLGPWWPGAAEVQGQLSGSLTAALAEEAKRPPEPMRVEMHAEMNQGRIGAAQLRDGHLVAYLGPRRLLINQATFRLLGGRIDGRANISPHAGKLYATVVTDINDIDLDQLAHVIQPETGHTPGRLAGSGNLLLASDLSSFSGRADIELSQSDLTNNGIVNTLYGAMRLNLGSAKPEGTGQMSVQLSGARVNVPSFVYFNRGIEIRGAGQIQDIWAGSASPIDGYAFSSTRILKGLSLPGVRELDRVVSSLQADAASVRIAGQLSQPEVKVVPLPAVSGALRRLLWDQLRGDQYQHPEE